METYMYTISQKNKVALTGGDRWSNTNQLSYEGSPGDSVLNFKLVTH
jgi:hypothetical protein